ncbi:S24/S26 family peptidase [Phocaeicola sp.]
MVSICVPVAEVLELAKECLAKGEQVVIRIRGNSMYPFLCDSTDLVALEAPVSDSLKRGNIVLFRYKNQYLLHRIINKKGANYYLRGDNNWSFHLETCKKENIYGIVVKVNRNGREISCDSWQWRFLSLLWIRTHKCRVCLYACYCYLRKVRK